MGTMKYDIEKITVKFITKLRKDVFMWQKQNLKQL